MTHKKAANNGTFTVSLHIGVTGIKTYIYNKDGEAIAVTPTPKDDPEAAELHEFIMMACNAHYSLVSALQMAMRTVNMFAAPDPIPPSKTWVEQLRRQVQRAIDKTKGAK